MKHIWEILTRTNSLWVDWIKNHLLKGRSIWQVSMPAKPSWTWRKILQVRDHCKNLFTVKIGNGKTTSLWFDYWMDGGQRPVDLLPYRHLATFGLPWSAKVSNIIEGSQWNLPEGSLNLQTLWNRIPIIAPNPQKDDMVIWEPHPKGIFSVDSAWELIRPHHPALAQFGILWQPGHIPRHSFILWLAIQGRLRTMDRSVVTLDCSSYALCNKTMETHDHLFFSCDYASRVWNNINTRAGLRWPNLQWNSLIQWDAANHHGRRNIRNRIARSILASSVYFLWLERNRRVFRGQAQGAQFISDQIFQTIRAQLSCMTSSAIPNAIREIWNLTISTAP